MMGKGAVWYLRGGWNAGILLYIHLGIYMSRVGIFCFWKLDSGEGRGG